MSNAGSGTTVPPAHRGEEAQQDDVEFLLSDPARAILAELATADLGADRTLSLIMALRQRVTPHQAGLLLSQARLRQRAAVKFPVVDGVPLANGLFFEEEALEQATSWAVAQHHARWIDCHSPPGTVLDLGCGIGGDTLALAAVRPVVAYDLDPERLRLAQANVAHAAAHWPAHHPVSCVEADWTEQLANGGLPPAAAAFADPARRVAGRRVFSLHDMAPPLSAILDLARRIPALGVKVAPGVADAEIPPQCAVEFISHQGVCKEAVLWFGPLAAAAPAPRWASVHTGDPSPTGWLTIAGTTEGAPVADLPAALISGGLWLHEPDPAVIRAGGLVELCHRLDATLFDGQIAYLIGPAGRTDPLVQSFRLLEAHSFGLKLLNQRLQALGMGRLEIKKRGSPIDPEQFRRKLKPADSTRPGVVLLTRQGDRRIMFIAERPVELVNTMERRGER